MVAKLKYKTEPACVMWYKVRDILNARDKAMKAIKAAFKLKSPDLAVYYRGDGLRKLYNSELQLDAICFCLGWSRKQLEGWVDSREKDMKEFDANERL